MACRGDRDFWLGQQKGFFVDKTILLVQAYKWSDVDAWCFDTASFVPVVMVARFG
jgi:hypothetical protein